jgi:hypothetical protein
VHRNRDEVGSCGILKGIRRVDGRDGVLRAYNAFMFCFATPFNQLFLLYVAMLALASWSLAALLWSLARRPLTTRIGSRPVAVYIWVIVALNALAWLRTIVPALGNDRPTAFLDGTGLTTNPVFVQDLAFWLPAMGVVGLLLWRAHPWGLLTASAGLVFWQLESVGVACDQWFGHRADPTSTVTSSAAVVMFAVLSVVGLVPTWALLRKVSGASPRRGASAA